MAFIISHSHFVLVAFVSITVFQTFDRMIFGRLSFPGPRWCAVIVWVPQMVRDQKKLETTALVITSPRSSTRSFANDLVPRLSNRKMHQLGSAALAALV